MRNLIELLKLKSIITLMLMSVLCYEVIIGNIGSDLFIPIVVTIITFYFAKSKEKE